MATRQQVLSLFGATPQQVMERQRQQQAEFLASQRDGFQQSGAAIGLGLARLFGGKSAEMQAAEQMQEAVSGIDPNNPDDLRNLATTVAQFAPERALQIAAYAGELEKSKMGETVPVPAIVGYETEPDIDPLTGLQRTDENKQPLFKRNPIFRNVPFERTPQGLKSLVPGYSLPSGASTAVRDEPEAVPAKEQKPTDTIIDLGDDVSLVRPGQIAETRAGNQTQPAPTTTPTQEPFVPQKGRIITDPEEIAKLERSLLDPNVQPVPSIAQPAIKGEIEYADPEALQEASDALRDQITKLEKSKDKNKAAKIKVLKRRRAEIQKLRLASRRKGVPADLQATGKVVNVLSGFRDAK